MTEELYNKVNDAICDDCAEAIRKKTPEWYVKWEAMSQDEKDAYNKEVELRHASICKSFGVSLEEYESVREAKILQLMKTGNLYG